MPSFPAFLLRLLLVALGLLFAASLIAVSGLMLGLWGLRSAWARLTGKPVTPFIFRVDPRAGFDRMHRRAQRGDRVPGADAVRPRPGITDVTDVEPKVRQG